MKALAIFNKKTIIDKNRKDYLIFKNNDLILKNGVLIRFAFVFKINK